MSNWKSIKIEDATTASQKAAVSAGGAVKVDNSAVTQPVSGTVAVTTVKPDGTNTMPSLDTTARRGYVQTADQFGYSADCSPNAELITCEKIRLVGAIFNGATLDTNFWTTGTLVNGTITVASSELVVTSGPANNDYAGVYTNRRATWITGTSNKFRCQMRLQEAADADLIRRWGVGWAADLTSTSITDGACFKLTGTALSIVTHANSTSGTEVASASFNGTYSAPTWTNNNTFEILYTLGKVYFLINSVIVHTVTASTTNWTSNTINLHAFADAKTGGDGSTAKTMTFRMMNICRLGAITTQPTYKYITNANTAQILKYGGGVLHSIIVGTCVNLKTINVFDDTAGAANQMIGITLPNSTDPFTFNLNCPFFNGLTVTPNDTGLKITVVYE